MRGAVLAAAFAALGSLGAAEGQERTELKQIRSKISTARKELAGQAKAEQSLLRKLDGLNQQVDARRRDLWAHERNLKLVEERLAAVSRLGAQYRLEAETGKSMLARGLRLAFKSGRMGELQLLFSSKDPAELLSRYRFLKSMARRNAARLLQTRASLQKSEEYQREYQSRELELKNHRLNAAQARSQAEAEKRRRSALLDSVRAKKSRTQALIRELGQSAQNLEQKMLELQRAAEEATRAERQKRVSQGGSAELDAGPSRLGRRHSLPWPVRGRMLTRFGEQMHPKFRTKIFNRGVEIGAPLGSPVQAVADGTVRFAGYFEGYGQMAILDHGGGYFTVYGHNSELQVAEGEPVRRGQAIAKVGDSSTLGRSSLYFEIRSLAKAVDPLLWLSR